MKDEEFLAALEDCTLPASEFSHTGHLRAAYLYLRDADFATALSRISASIRNYATALGQPGRYHETITVAYTALIHQHIQMRGMAENWSEFAAANPELLDRKLLSHFFAPEVLASDLARRTFILPQRMHMA
ncbi:MAG TPA: hypothetical protein VGO53_15135 [Steroidobacteraceae bacterium]|jgi:hypothetical protein|nr:hypothetical protein [Steroidobacteraceae bacterium]